MPTTSCSAVTLPYHQRDWIDVEPGQYDKTCFEVSKKDDQIASTRSFSSWIQDLGTDCFVQNLRLLSIGQFEHGWITCRKEEVLRRDISIVWIHTLLTPSETFEQCKATLEENTEIQHCKTTCCCRTTPPSTSTTLEAPTTCTRSSNQDWFPEAKASRKGYMRCSLRPWSQCLSINTEKGITTWRSPGLQCTNTFGKYTKTQWIGAIWGLFRAMDCSSIKHDPTRSSFTALYLRCASRRWWSGSLEKNVQQNVSISNLTGKNCTQTELALWTPGHYKLWHENVVRPF